MKLLRYFLTFVLISSTCLNVSSVYADTSKAAKQPYGTASYKLGNMYYYGKGVPQNYKKAFWNFINASRRNSTLADFMLSKMYAEGQGVSKNLLKACEWQVRALNYSQKHRLAEYQLAAGQGDRLAMQLLGFMYLKGLGVTSNPEKAVELNKRAASQGDVSAMLTLGTLYKDNAKLYDEKKAFKWFSMAADKGNAYAMFALGQMYLEGKGTTKNRTKGLKSITLAAEKGSSQAMLVLAKQSEPKIAFNYILKAAKLGNPEGQVKLAALYEKGLGVNKDPARALVWYTKAAEQGNLQAKDAIERIESDAKK